MAHVHKKRLETMRRERAAGALLGSPRIIKPSGPVSTTKHTRKTLPDRHPNTNSTASAPTPHTRKRSLITERLARLLDDVPVPAASMASERELEARNAEEQDPACVSSIASSEVEMDGLEATEYTLADVLEDKDDTESDGKWKPLEMTASGRPYGTWRGEYHGI